VVSYAVRPVALEMPRSLHLPGRDRVVTTTNLFRWLGAVNSSGFDRVSMPPFTCRGLPCLAREVRAAACWMSGSWIACRAGRWPGGSDAALRVWLPYQSSALASDDAQGGHPTDL